MNDVNFDVVLSENIVKAMSYADIDPETSLIHARKSAEAISYSVFSNEIGNPGTKRLDTLIELLVKNDKLPQRIKIPLKVIQQYGNYAAHYQPQSIKIERSYIEPCLSALVHVTNWYFHDYLNIAIPQAVLEANNNYEDKSLEYDSESSDEFDKIRRALELPFILRSYQWEGVKYLLNTDNLLLADEMGLGKTVQVIVALKIMLTNAIAKRILIIVPNSLVYNWLLEFDKWAPNIVTRRVIGTQADRLATYQLPIQVLIATYDQIGQDYLNIDSNTNYDIAILDEGQRVKNRNSRISLACRLINRNRTWILTGTPLENDLEDLMSLFLLISPGLVDMGMPISEIHRRIKPYFLRRRKKDVLEDMPELIVQDYFLEMQGGQKAAYNDVWNKRRELISANNSSDSCVTLFAVINELKQLCNYDVKSGMSAKLEALINIVDELLAADEKIIVFSQYVKTLKYLSKQLEGIPHCVYSGELSQDKKNATLNNFKSALGPSVLLMSLRAGALGLNIQEAARVVLYDRWWNPAIENQAIQRAHRYGREGPLHVIRFHMLNSVEDSIAKILERKEAYFNKYIDDASNSSVSLFTKEELLRILELTKHDLAN